MKAPALLAAACLAACQPPIETVNDEAEACPVTEPIKGPPPPAFAAFVGGGIKRIFVPHASDGGLALQRGCQGAQHIFTSVRMVGAAPGLVRVQIEVRRVTDDALISVPVDLRLAPEADPASDAASLITGLTPVVEVPRDVLGREAKVRVHVIDAKGATAESEMRGIVSWGADSCGVH